MILYIENSNTPPKNLEVIMMNNELSKVVGHETKIQKLVVDFNDQRPDFSTKDI